MSCEPKIHQNVYIFKNSKHNWRQEYGLVAGMLVKMLASHLELLG